MFSVLYVFGYKALVRSNTLQNNFFFDVLGLSHGK